jgi:hypothetical protein
MRDQPRPKSKKGKPRVTRQALERAREQIKQAETQPRSKSQGEERGSRDGDRWITLPDHLARYAGEQAVISSGFVWTHHLDWATCWEDEKGVGHIPVKGVCLGPVEVLTEPEKIKPGGKDSSYAKTPDFVSEQNSSRPGDHQQWSRSFGIAGGRPKKDAQDALIMSLAKEGKSIGEIARTLRRQGTSISPRTIARRLAADPKEARA